METLLKAREIQIEALESIYAEAYETGLPLRDCQSFVALSMSKAQTTEEEDNFGLFGDLLESRAIYGYGKQAFQFRV